MLQRTDENQQVAAQLREAASLLQAQGANPFRVSAYRNAANTIAHLPRPVREIFDAGGRAALDALPNVGAGIAGAIAEMLLSGGWSQLARLRGSAEPEKLFLTVPGIGPSLAHVIHEELHADTLEALEAAANDGRLEQVPGVGERRAAAIRAALSSMLGRRIERPPGAAPGAAPPVAMLLEVDREYRDRAAAGTLRTSRPSASTRRARPGCRSCMRSGAIGISPRCTRIPRGRTTWAAPGTGS